MTKMPYTRVDALKLTHKTRIILTSTVTVTFKIATVNVIERTNVWQLAKTTLVTRMVTMLLVSRSKMIVMTPNLSSNAVLHTSECYTKKDIKVSKIDLFTSSDLNIFILTLKHY